MHLLPFKKILGFRGASGYKASGILYTYHKNQTGEGSVLKEIFGGRTSNPPSVSKLPNADARMSARKHVVHTNGAYSKEK